MGWGVDLWDCVEEVFGHVTGDMEEVCGVFGKFIKERGEVEKEYAKRLRKLCSKYSVKGEEGRIWSLARRGDGGEIILKLTFNNNLSWFIIFYFNFV